MEAPIHLQEHVTPEEDAIGHPFNMRSSLRSRDNSPSSRNPRLLFGIKRLGRPGKKSEIEEGRSIIRKENISAPQDAHIIDEPTRRRSLAATPAAWGSPPQPLIPKSCMSSKLSPTPTGLKSTPWRGDSTSPDSPISSGATTSSGDAPPLTARSIRFPDETGTPDGFQERQIKEEGL